MISRAEIQTVADKITTIGQARLALGIEAEQLRTGYDLLVSIGTNGGILHDYTPFGTVEDVTSGQARDAARDILDQANAYAQGIYATLPKEADNWMLDDKWRGRVAAALLTGLTAVNAVQELASELRPNYSEEYFAALSTSIGSVTGAIGNAVASVASGIGLLPILGALAVVLLIVYISTRGKVSVGV